jgi:hypothetical protein
MNFFDHDRSLARLGVGVSVGLCAVLAVQGASAQSLVSAPSWVTAMTPGTWIAVGNNKIADVDPAADPAANPNFPGKPPWNGNTGQIAVTTTWNGGAVARGYGAKGSLIAWGGGHQDYYGNEIYAFDLNTLTWSRLTNPYKSVSFPVSNGIWPDGTPSVPHTYAMAGYHPGTNSFACMYTQDSNTPSNVSVAVFFDFDTMTWRRSPRNSSTVVYGGWAAYDSSRDAWWMEGGDSGGVFAKFTMNGDGTAGTWTNYGAKFSALDSRAVRDPIHDILVITTFRQNDNMYGLDLKNPGNSTVQLTQNGTAPVRDGANGWEWSDSLQSIVYWRRGGSVYQVVPPAGDWKTGNWTWIPLTAGSNTVTPADPSSGVYSRFQLMRYTDAEIAVVVNDVSGKVYAFRMPTTGAAKVPNAPVLTSVQ